jgi:molybdopterin-guanine dinucleotide biosynthesis protein A
MRQDHAAVTMARESTADETVPEHEGGEYRRYTLVLPTSLLDDVRQFAEQRQTTVIDVLRRAIKIGLIVARLEEKADAAVIIREGDKEQRVLFV